MTAVADALRDRAVDIDDTQFRVLADNLPTLCWYGRADGTILWFNRRWYDYTGSTPELMAANGWQSVHDPSSLPDVLERIRPSFEAGRPFDLIVQLRGADGVYRPFLSNVQPVHDGNGVLSCWVGTCTDVSEQLQAERLQAFLLELGDATREESDPETILAVTAAMVGTELGADRIVYATIDWTSGVMHVNRDWRADGSVIPGHRLPMSIFPESYVTAHSRGDTLMSADTDNDTEVSPALRERFATTGTKAVVSVPLVKRGDLRAIMTAQHFTPRAWSPAELRLLCEVAVRTWATIERARFQANLAIAEHRRTFLLAMSDRLRGEADPARVLSRTAQEIGEYLRVRHVIFSEIDDDGLHLVISHSWSDGSVPPRSGRWPLSMLGDKIMDAYRRGQTVASDDIEAELQLPEALLEAFRSIGVRAYATAPVLSRGRLWGMLSVQAAEPRRWSESEFELIEAVAERSWEALERARGGVALRESEQLFRMVIEAHPIPVVIAQGDGLVLGNPAFFELAGVAEGDLAAVDPKVWSGWSGGWDELVAFVRQHPRHDHYETTMRRDGKPFPVSMSWRHISYRGSPAVIASLIDLTEAKRAQIELQRSREALHQAEKLSALGSLLAGVSHELNNPLSVVTTQSMLLEDIAAGTPLAERAAKVRHAAERCSRIVQTFLGMARQKRPERKLVSAAEIVRSALDLTDYSLRTAGIRVTSELVPGLPPLEVDADQLHQVLVNLIVNAQHALQDIPGPRELTVRVYHDENLDHLRIEVADNGHGVPDDIRRRVFEPFFTTKPQGVGTGVGLSFSLGIIEAHGGRLELVDQPSCGTCFRITLAAAKLAAPGTDDEPCAVEGVCHAAGRALIVDDEAELAEALAIFVGRAGYQVRTALNGIEAQQLLSDGDYDLVVSDLRMPGMDGPALYDWLERHRPHLIDRIGFVTGDTLGAAAARFIGRTGRPVIEKPFTPESVRELVDKIARRAPVASEA